jgi:hypothetical protein
MAAAAASGLARDSGLEAGAPRPTGHGEAQAMVTVTVTVCVTVTVVVLTDYRDRDGRTASLRRGL